MNGFEIKDGEYTSTIYSMIKVTVIVHNDGPAFCTAKIDQTVVLDAKNAFFNLNTLVCFYCCITKVSLHFLISETDMMAARFLWHPKSRHIEPAISLVSLDPDSVFFSKFGSVL